MEDQDGRCAYSMQHYVKAGGVRAMEVDHHNPKKKKRSIQAYSNLLLATKHTNNFKSDTWPSDDEIKKGLRFLDPSKEQDYGEHIFEDPDTHFVFGVTPAGKYHVINCDLNAEHLVHERRERAKWLKISKGKVGFFHCPLGHEEKALQGLKQFDEEFIKFLIPSIPYRKFSPKKGHRRRLVIA